MQSKTWRLNAYSANTFTDLVVASAVPVIKTITVANGPNATTVIMRVVNASGDVVSTLITGEPLIANASYVCDLPLVVLNPSERLQVSASATGASFTASGEE